VDRPTLLTKRLVLRPFRMEDAPEVQRLAGAREVAATTATIPHPYEDGMAEAWIASHRETAESGEDVVFAITLREGGALVGAIGMRVKPRHERAELGYWVGVPYWGKGYATEASRAMLDHGFGALGLRRIYAHHFVSNAASGRVLLKIGMKLEGRLRQHMEKWGEWHDLDVYGVLREEWEEGRVPG
jgi:RimJ/RimL family protein N-acetyltransferase